MSGFKFKQVLLSEPQRFGAIRVCLNTAMAAPKEESLNAATASVTTELGSIFLLREEQRMHWGLFMMEKDIFTFLTTGFQQFNCPTGWYFYLFIFIKLVEVGQPVIDSWFIQSPAQRYLKVPVLLHKASKNEIPDSSVWQHHLQPAPLCAKYTTHNKINKRTGLFTATSDSVRLQPKGSLDPDHRLRPLHWTWFSWSGTASTLSDSQREGIRFSLTLPHWWLPFQI